MEYLVFLVETRSLLGVSGIALFLFLLCAVIQSRLRNALSGPPGAAPKWLHPGPPIKHSWPARVEQRPATPVPVRHVAKWQQVIHGCMLDAPLTFAA
jgi:hypothetical protein